MITKGTLFTTIACLFGAPLTTAQASSGDELRYQLEVIARSGGKTPAGNTITNLGWGPSINDAGRVAYKVEITDGRQGIFVSGEPSARSLVVDSFHCWFTTFFDLSRAFRHDDVVQINNLDQISWRAQSKDGEHCFLFRVGTSASETVVVARNLYNRIDTPDIDFPSPFCGFPLPNDALFPWVALNNTGRTVFSALACPDAGGTVLATLQNLDAYCPNTSGDYWYVGMGAGTVNAFPVLSDKDHTLVRNGGSRADPLILFQDATFADAWWIAGEPEFPTIGDRSGISDDSQLVVFSGISSADGIGVYGEATAGVFKIAGLSGDGHLDPRETWIDSNGNGRVDPGEDYGFFSAFYPEPRVAANRSGDGEPDSYTVAFLAATNGPGGLGLYTVKIDLTDLAAPTISKPTLVVQTNHWPEVENFPGRINSIKLYDPINNNGELAFWVNTDGGQAIVKASPSTNPCEECAKICPLGHLTTSLGSIKATFGLGQASGESSASLKIRTKTPSSVLSTPGALLLSGPMSEFEPVYQNAVLRQVKGPNSLADIIVTNSFRYVIRFFPEVGSRNTSTGLYEPVGSPVSTILVENPDGITSNNRLRITRNGSEANLFTYTPASNTWELATGFANGLRRETLEERTIGILRTQTRTIRDGNSNIVSETISLYQAFPWGEELIQTTEGVSPNTRAVKYTYYTNRADGFNYRRLRKIQHSTGYWEYYKEYGSRGLLRSVRQFGNNPYAETGSWPDANNRSAEVKYTGNIETHFEYLKGRLVSKRWHNLVQTGETWDCVATHPAITNWNNPSNLITRTFIYQTTDTSGARSGQTHKVINPDGTMTLYRYYTESIPDPFSTNTPPPALPVRRTVTDTGQTDANSIEVVDGQRTETVEDLYGNIIARREYDIASGLLAGVEVTTIRDVFGRPTRIEYLDGTSITRAHDCCGLESESDREGVTARYNTDHVILLDVNQDGTNETYYGTTVTRAGISTHTLTDALGRAFKTILQGTNGALIVQDERVYNILGDLDWSRDAMGRITTYSETNAGGFVVRTTTFPDGSQSIESTYQDGSAYETLGDAVQRMRYSTDVVEDNSVWVQTTTQTRLEPAGSLSPEYVTSYTDFAGRAYRTEYPWPDGAGPVFATTEYNLKGQLAQSTDPDGLTTLYAYNGRGELETTALDLANRGIIDYGGTDRITRTTSLVENSALRGTVVRKTVTEVWETNGVNQPTILRTSETSADGTQTWSTQYGLTTHTTTAIDRSNQRRTVTTTNSDGTSTVTVFEQGWQRSVTRYDANTNRVTQATLAYDAFGRLATETDARNGPTTYTYYDDDQLHTVTTPDPDPGAAGPGKDAQITSYTYYRDPANGIKTVTTLPDGGVVTQEYFPSGQLKKAWGARTYPAEYTYDRSGRVATLTTWQRFDFTAGTGIAGSATTHWNYNARGLLANKRYADDKGPNYTYTAGGKLKTRLWARGVLTTYGYDPQAGDLLTTTYSDATPAVTNTYDRLGRLASVTDASGLRTFGYHHGQTATESYGPGLFAGLTLVRDYDDLDRQSALSVTSPTGAIYHVTYGYDAASRLHAVTSGVDVALYTYHPDSDLVHTLTQSHSNEVRLTTTKLYDELGRLQSITSVPSVDSPISFAYDYNDVNQRTRATLANGEYWTYGYDALGQVTNGVKRFPKGAPIPGYNFGYQFDHIGNRLLATRDGRTDIYTNNLLNQIVSIDYAPWLHVLGMVSNNASITVNGQTPVRSNGYFYAQVPATNVWNTIIIQARAVGAATNGSDALAEDAGHNFSPFGTAYLQYDDDGNMLSDTRWMYAWDAENRIVKKQTLPAMPLPGQRKLEYALDANGRRARVKASDRSSGTWTLTSDQKFTVNDLEVLSEMNTATSTVDRSFIWGLDLSDTRTGAGGVGGLLSLRDQSTQLLIPDANGNVNVLVSTLGGRTSGTYEYEPFGSTLRLTGPTTTLNPFRFSTKFYEGEAGDIHYEYRNYSASLGSWLSREPYGEDNSINLYTVVDNDCINYSDADGLRRRTFGHGTRQTPLTLVRSLIGLPFSIVSGDYFYSDIKAIPRDTCNVLIVVNGVWNKKPRAEYMLDELAKTSRYAGAYPLLSYNRHGGVLRDIVQIVGDELGGIQSASYQVARQVNEVYAQFKENGCCCGRIQIFAHSQGTKVLQSAFPLIDGEARQLVCATGIGGETKLSASGIASTTNLRNLTDPIPYLQFGNPLNWPSQPFVPEEQLSGGKHVFESYLPWVRTLPPDCPCNAIDEKLH